VYPGVAYRFAVSNLEQIARGLEGYQPTLLPTSDRARAAVAVILRERAQRAELLFIERARREGDPWSGHMAFPGGRVDPADRGTRQAAERETLEEVGVSLADGTYLGRLDDLEGRPQRDGGMVVSAYVYRLAKSGPLVPNHEVHDAFWFPVAALLDAERHVTYPHARFEGRHLPGILVGVPDRQIVWGLTYRFVDVLLSVIGQPLPNHWTDLR
jgi:8-oxo-dGTP pyrophosphatase MutT (NUDIX family)